jgi:MFS transporter, FHS family, L-fucose permease
MKNLETPKKTYLIPLLIIGGIFFVIGFGIGISGFLTPALRSAFDLGVGESYLVTAAIFSAFVIFGRPSAWVISHIGYRKSMVAAFAIMGAGMLLFVPSATTVSFPLFLLALFVGGIGNTLLQAAVNPYITIVGPMETAAVRMSLMGIMNKLAWWAAPLFLGLFIDLQEVRLGDVIMPFYLVGGILLLLGIGVYFAPLPEVRARGEDQESKDLESKVPEGKGHTGNERTEFLDPESDHARHKRSILQFPHLLLGALAIFLYAGIEILPMASIIDFARASFGDEPNLERYAGFVTVGLIAGYVFGVMTIPKIISQGQALTLFSFIGIASSLLLVLLPVQYAFFCLLLVSFANSLMWPAIWPLAIADLGKFTKAGSSILVMGIVGGGVIPLVFGFLVGLGEGGSAVVSNYQNAYWILLPAYLFILYFALHGHRIRTGNGHGNRTQNQETERAQDKERAN